MGRTVSHGAVADLLGAYVLDAVDPDEAVAVRDHLDGCPRCRGEVTELQQTAGMLASTGGAAPAGVWDAIADRINRPNASIRDSPTVPRLSTGPTGPTRRTVRGRLHVQAGVMLVAAAAVALIGILGADVVRLNHRVSRVADSAARQSLSTSAKRALLDPQARRIRLESTGTSAHAAAEIVTLRSGASYFLNSRLPVLPAGLTYQLWAMIDGRSISVGLLGTSPATVAFTLDPADLTRAFTVTVEPAAGSVIPTRPPVADTAL